MPLKNGVPTFWNIALRIVASTAIALSMALQHRVDLPGSALVSVGQITLYLSFIVVPLPMNRLLLKPDIETKLARISGEVIRLPRNARGQLRTTVPVIDFWDTAVEKAANLHFVDRVATSRIIKINEQFHRNFVPVLVTTSGAFILALYLKLTPTSAQPANDEVTKALTFVQAILALLPVVWTLGNIHGEIDTQRDVVRAAL